MKKEGEKEREREGREYEKKKTKKKGERGLRIFIIDLFSFTTRLLSLISLSNHFCKITTNVTGFEMSQMVRDVSLKYFKWVSLLLESSAFNNK